MTESVITVAARELGYTERPINRTKYGQAFGLDGAPWCAIWIWWVFQYAGQPLPVKAAACSVLLQSFRQRKQFHSTPAPGDVFFCGATGGDHTDLVESVKPDGRTFTTIEGNASAGGSYNGTKVVRRTRKVGDGRVFGFGRPCTSISAVPVRHGSIRRRPAQGRK